MLRHNVKSKFTLLLIALVVVCLEGLALAQQTSKVPRVGIFGNPRHQRSRMLEAFRQGLHERGYIEGQNIILQPEPIVPGDIGRHDQIAASFVRQQIDIIVAGNYLAVFAAMKATNRIPIVIIIPGDPVLPGFVRNLKRPGGNVTGVSGITSELGGKWLELLKETVPSIKRVAVFWNREAENYLPTWKSVEEAAQAHGVDLEWLEVRVSTDTRRKVKSALWSRPDAFVVLPAYVRNMIEEIADGALKSRLPSIFWRTDFDLDDNGGLMAYGANRMEQSRRAAYVVDKILKGAKPADLPLELPKSFELVINLKIAKQIGVTIPPRVLAWADRVIK
jgi:putative ABC transport system substrate-binding protein